MPKVSNYSWYEYCIHCFGHELQPSLAYEDVVSCHGYSRMVDNTLLSAGYGYSKMPPVFNSAVYMATSQLGTGLRKHWPKNLCLEQLRYTVAFFV